MAINGSVVVVGDQLFDIMQQATGTVETVSSQGMRVTFGPVIGSRNYNTDGTSGGIRRLYWRNPILIEPRKDDPYWNTYRNILIEVQEQMNIVRT